MRDELKKALKEYLSEAEKFNKEFDADLYKKGLIVAAPTLERFLLFLETGEVIELKDIPTFPPSEPVVDEEVTETE